MSITALFLTAALTVHMPPLKQPIEIKPMPAEIQDLYDEALIKNHVNLNISTGVKTDKSINAFATSNLELDDGEVLPHVVIVHTGLIDDTTTAQLLFVLGHETGHLMLQHTRGAVGFACHSSNALSRSCEQAADIYAIQFMKNSGYSACVSLDWFAKMVGEHDNGATDYTNLTHPSDRERFNNINKLANCGRTPYEVKPNPKPVNHQDRELD